LEEVASIGKSVTEEATKIVVVEGHGKSDGGIQVSSKEIEKTPGGTSGLGMVFE